MLVPENQVKLNSCHFVPFQFQHVPGQLVNLLRVAVEDSLDIGLRQVASITFKNLVRKDWDPSGTAIP